jgi:hypothetical protein
MANVYTTAFDSDNISIGPCLVYFKGQHVGHTFGGVTLSLTQNVYELKSDQYGDTPVKVLDAGIGLEVTANLTEATFTNMKMLFSSAVDQGNYLTFGKPVGGAINTGELILEPTDGSEPIQIYKAAANLGSTIEIGFTTDNQRVYQTKFSGLIDDSRSPGDQLFRIGGITPAYPQFDVTLTVVGSGSISIGGATYTSAGSPHVVKAKGSTTIKAAFSGGTNTLAWSGTDGAQVVGTYPNYVLNVDANKAITATFTTV